MAAAFLGVDSHVLATILDPFQTIFDDFGPNQESRIAMRILILEIANGMTNQSRVHDQRKPAKKDQLH